MARKVRVRNDDEDDAPEVISRAASKADAKRSQKALRDFEAEEKARQKARNRDRDQKLKERARATKKSGKTSESPRRVRFLEDKSGVDGDEDEDEEARMLRAMREAADEAESGDGEVDDDDDDDGDDDGDGGFTGIGEGMDVDDGMASGSDSFSLQDDDDDDAGVSLGEGDSIDSEVLTDDGELGEEDDDKAAALQNQSTNRSKAGYLPDDLFTTAFASKPVPKKTSAEATPKQTVKKQRRKSTAHPKDLVIGGRIIRTLPRLSDPRSQATARSVPSARARKFLDYNLAMKGKQALLKAKKRGWERRPGN